MTEADILAMTYDDRCSVFRAAKETLPSGESVFHSGTDGMPVYTDIPCALSSPSGGKLTRSPSTASVPTDYVLFTRPEIEIKPNDTVVVTHLGLDLVLYAGLAMRYPSHIQLPLKLKKEMV